MKCPFLSSITFGALLASAPAAIDFARDVRPMFSENCFACHGPDSNKRKAGLRLDEKESALARRVGRNRDYRRRRGEERTAPARDLDGQGRGDAAAEGAQEAQAGAGRLAAALDQGRREVDGPLGVSAGESRRCRRNQIRIEPEIRSTHSSARGSKRRGSRLRRRRSRPRCIRRVSLDLTGLPPTHHGGGCLSRGHIARTPTRRSSIVCSPRRISASAWRCRGSISRATATPAAITTIRCATCGSGASG